MLRKMKLRMRLIGFFRVVVTACVFFLSGIMLASITPEAESTKDAQDGAGTAAGKDAEQKAKEAAKTEGGAGSNFNSVDDIVSNPKSLYGKSKDDVASIVGNDWTEGTYGSEGTGWKFTKGDQSIFYHPEGGIHVGSYYGYSSGDTGRIKIVSPEYIPFSGDKATIIPGI